MSTGSFASPKLPLLIKCVTNKDDIVIINTTTGESKCFLSDGYQISSQESNNDKINEPSSLLKMISKSGNRITTITQGELSKYKYSEKHPIMKLEYTGTCEEL